MVLMLGQSRVLFAMARDGLLPRALAKTGPHGTPVRVTVLVAILIAVAASVFPIGKLEEMVNVGTLFAFVLVSAGVVVLRRSRPDLKRGFRVPWVPVVPIASIVACAVADAQPDGADLDPLPDLDGARGRDLLRVRPQSFGAGAARAPPRSHFVTG